MTAKRDSKSKPKKDRPKIKEETVKDLDAKNQQVSGGELTRTRMDNCSL